MKKLLLVIEETWYVNGEQEPKDDERFIDDRSEVKKYIDDWLEGWKYNEKNTPGWKIVNIKRTPLTCTVRMQISGSDETTRIDTFQLYAKVRKVRPYDFQRPIQNYTTRIPPNSLSPQTFKLFKEQADFIQQHKNDGVSHIVWRSTLDSIIHRKKLGTVPPKHRSEVLTELKFLYKGTRGFDMIFL